jgi:hypothetical protein
MAKKEKALFEMTIEEFESCLRPDPMKSDEERRILASPARLIPGYKKLDEKSLASVFLASLPLVKEFRDSVFREMGMGRTGYLKVYTEVSFPRVKIYQENSPKKGPLRVDGLVLQVVGKQIKDAAIFEFKMGAQEIYAQQINAYMELAKEVGVPRLVSVSNQFVPSPTDYPIEVNRSKAVALYHFSWRYIIMLGSILLTDNDYNIADPDQVLIMSEVMAFLRDPTVEAKTFDQMSEEWVAVVKGLGSDKDFAKKGYACIDEAVRNWIEEEQDLALKMSDELGSKIDCRFHGIKSFKQRIEVEKQRIVKESTLSSELKFPNTVSPLRVMLDLARRRLFCDVMLQVPAIAMSEIHKKAGIKGQLRYVEKQLDRCRRKNEAAFDAIKQDLYLEVLVKGKHLNPNHRYGEWEQLIEESVGKQIISVRVTYQKLLDSLTKRRVFITEYELAVRNFYAVIVQHLKNPPVAPRSEMVVPDSERVSEEKTTQPRVTADPFKESGSI